MCIRHSTEESMVLNKDRLYYGSSCRRISACTNNSMMKSSEGRPFEKRKITVEGTFHGIFSQTLLEQHWLNGKKEVGEARHLACWMN